MDGKDPSKNVTIAASEIEVSLLTILGRPAEELRGRLTPSCPRERRHSDAVICKGVQAVQLQELPLRLLRQESSG